MMLIVSCPNCGGDDEAWFYRAGAERSFKHNRFHGNVIEVVFDPPAKPYIQDCVKCGFIYNYDDYDVINIRGTK